MNETKFFDGVNAIQQAEEFLQSKEIETNERFVKVKSNNFKIVGQQVKLNKVFWEEHSSPALPIAFDGVPFAIIGRQVQECCHGPDRHRSQKKKKAKLKECDHLYTDVQRRRNLQTTHKLECPASVVQRYVVRFPDYMIQSNSDYQRKKMGAQLKADLQKGLFITQVHRVYLSYPPQDSHRFHLQDELGTISHRVDKRIITKIHSLVHEGIRSVSEMRRHIEIFSKENFPTASRLSNQFYPTNKDIRNHMYSALCLERFSTEDQTNLMEVVNQWKIERPSDSFHYITGGRQEDTDETDTVEDFLFVHQTQDQKRLLNKYGNEICLLDATYNTSKYDVPLFFVCVNTNVCYSVVGSFIASSETIENIRRGLAVLKDWNPAWNPSFFITDFDWKEIKAVESTFPGCFTYLCDFHREQAWKRWVGPSNGISHGAKDLLALMRTIANADSEEALEAAINSLKETETWKENPKFQDWFQKHWLSNAERWVQYHRQSLFNVRVNTTNGLERQHQEFKKNYLAYYTQGSLTSMVKTIVTRFLPDSYKRYVQYNIRALNMKISTEIPNFLRNKSRMFIEHCLKRLPASDDDVAIELKQTGPKTFRLLSSSSGNYYDVNLGTPLPRCSCRDWFDTHLPCKHILYILMNVPGQEWETLNEAFTKCPHFNLDEDLVCAENSQTQNLTETPSTTNFEESNRSSGHGSVIQQSKPKSRAIAIGSKCKMLTARINSMMYLIRDQGDYEELFSGILNLYNKVKDKIPTKAGLFLRKPTIGRQTSRCLPTSLKLRKNRRKKKRQKCVTEVKSRSEPSTAFVNRVIPQDPSIVLDSQSENGKHTLDHASNDREVCQAATPSHGNKQDEAVGTEVANVSHADSDEIQAFRCVQQLWQLQQDHDIPVAKVCGITVTDTDVRSLRDSEWLTDNVLDCYLKMLVTWECDKGRKVLHLLSSQVKSIVNGTFQPHNYTFQLSDYSTVIGVYHRAAHWTLMVADILSSTLYFYNPVEEHTEEMVYILNGWRKFLTAYNNSREDSVSTEWTITTQPHARQEDSCNCGVYCIIFAEKHLQMASMVTVSQFELKEKRRRIATEIMLFEEFLTNCCPKCGFDLKPDDEKICCGKCLRYFHFKEYCIGEDLREMEDNNHFSCRLCRIQFWPAQRILKHPEVMKNSVQFTQKEEILEKLKGHFDDDVVLVDGKSKSKERNCNAKRTREPKETEHYKEHCRKRKRKDQRKSSLFMYTFPKKTLKKIKYCVCQQENDGRLYWRCDGCKQWYHPECMGLEEKDEPDLYICPDCQLKRKEKHQNSCPTLSEVCEEVRIQMKEESADPMDADNCGDLENVSYMTPVYFNNPVVQFFYDVQKQKKILYTIKDSGWGKFVLLPEHDMCLFETFKEKVNIDYLLTDSAALRYFLNNISQNTELMHVSENVVCLHPAAAVEDFKEWLDNIKVNISSDL